MRPRPSWSASTWRKRRSREAARPMPVRVSAWAIYDVFETAREGEQLFVGVVSDGQWKAFCAAFDLGDLGGNPAYTLNNQRVAARDHILPQVRALFAAMPRKQLVAKPKATALPFEVGRGRGRERE